MNVDKNLEAAVEKLCGAKVRWQGFIPVTERLRDQTVWEGLVSIFDCPNGRIYAWVEKRGTQVEYITVPAKRPIKSPWDAVRAWLAGRR